jgi:1-acyl-sn-glycerol-3-phosphate acyltransferase
MSVVRTIVAFAFFVPTALLGALLGYPIARAVGSRPLLCRMGRACVGSSLALAGVRWVVEGRERLADARNVVLVANHASYLDGPLVFAALGVDFTTMVKNELSRFPMRGPLLFVGFIPVDRSDPVQSADAMEKATAALRAGGQLLVFPEGMRSPDGRLGEFKRGAFALALEAGSRVVPLAVQGSGRLMPRGGLTVRPGLVRIRVLDPVDARAFGPDGREALAAEVRSRLAAALEEP